jgi:hypothetical protein
MTVQAMTKIPRLKRQQSETFWNMGSCRWRISLMGRQIIIMSVTMLRTDVAI